MICKLFVFKEQIDSKMFCSEIHLIMAVQSQLAEVASNNVGENLADSTKSVLDAFFIYLLVLFYINVL